MSNTRKAAPGAPLKQSKFSSSTEFETGLLGNLVARRCAMLERAEDRELVWFIQYLSHQPGGLKAVAADILKQFSDRIGTQSMRKFGCRAGQIYDAEKVRAVRKELPSNNSEFPLRGEFPFYIWDQMSENSQQRRRELEADSQKHPNKYPASDFDAICRQEFRAEKIETALQEFCLNPAVSLSDDWPWWFSDFATCLREYQTAWIAQRGAGTVTTELGKQVGDVLDYALETKCLVLIDGLARMGKTFSAKAWCAQRPGRARYIEVPSTNDDTGFYRALAKALGVACGTSMKSIQLRERVEEALQTGDLFCCFDEAHYCWPNSNYHHALPGRINWILNALVNKNVPVALITTPQFIKTQKVVEARTNWTSEQFIGRIGHYQKLPDSLAEGDLSKVASALLPEGDETSLEILVRYAQSSAKYLAGIEAVVRRARYLAKQDSRAKVTRADIKLAIQQSVIPSDSALTQALADPPKRDRRASAAALNQTLKSDSEAVKPRSGAHSDTDLVSPRLTETPATNRASTLRASAPLVPG
jgi:hypothetical protein